MPSPILVCQQINQLIGYLLETGLASDQNGAFVRDLQNDFIEVTFPKSEQLTITLKNSNYLEIYNSLASERAFTIKLPDGALILMRYIFEKNLLQRHILGFYPSPNLEEFQNNPDVYLEDVVYADIVARNVVPFPIRFDFDCREDIYIPIKHPKSHLTLGQYKKCRIPVTAPLTPYWFISFLLRNFYNTAYEEYAESMPFFKAVFKDSISTDECNILHIKIPDMIS